MIFLQVPFPEKDQAKSLGARWDAVSKLWYIPEHLLDQKEQFSKWLPLAVDESSVLEEENTEEIKAQSLSLVMRQVQRSLRQYFSKALWLTAEIANLNNNRGHLYLELTESDQQGRVLASCRATIWKSQAEMILKRFSDATGSQLEKGLKVLCLAEVNFHEIYGFSLNIQEIDPNYTLGELQQQQQKIRLALKTAGIFENNRTQLLKEDFQRIAVIAPPDAAGLGDFRADANLLQKHQLCEFTYFYSSFQGQSTEQDLLTSIEAVHAIHAKHPFDALVIIRGGGSKLDLNQLNIESVARQICLAKLPVLTGIGHERDLTILDEVANRHFDTPSKVIGFIRQSIFQQAQQAKYNWQQISTQSQLRLKHASQNMERLQQQISQSSQLQLAQWKSRLEPLITRVQHETNTAVKLKKQALDQYYTSIAAQTKPKLEWKSEQLDELMTRIHQQGLWQLKHKKETIRQWIGFVLSAGPQSQLERGFALVYDQKQQPVINKQQALNEQSLTIEFVDGKIQVDVQAQQELI
ncbi:exodeoxyribonuclease VII large subunit [Thiomicrorhabdus sp.]|uniref:exodeoxyribonuclease VII large subunit n=1 Tax=Thiomicrorhabdus sp. TaxID=2039724 RepID=UPI0029C97569|nr:exodeoxyribonuclease VII large subunit [Thiomicrorhabdus sp.]